ncbi:sodium/glutamate symporter [Ignatzschineria sp. RMDPL8A]|uniref:sodium/glutamate symporter n=1 Tax=Ignatzschineria sp. RMDPL8A TaxID=2999236 RepID=UPI0024466DC9|nr:sodium/glutamate symporter [Ignatzschineria sp. RMDPL8A]MDG9728846.1 sodium/glutamate symporter [Ignatzschineria sp. RMDPL8A]
MFQLDSYLTLIAATLALLLGGVLVRRIAFLHNNHIPEAVVGGFVVAVLLLLFNKITGISIGFDSSLQSLLMIVFFTSIGLSADFSRLIQGGKPLIVFIIAVSVLIIVQNIVGMSLAMLLGQDPFYGLIAGSITLSGGHGNGAAWGAVLSEKYGITSAVELAMACATFGLVLGGFIGGPVARHLLKKIKKERNETPYEIKETFEEPNIKRQIHSSSIIETVGMLTVSISLGSYLDVITKETIFHMPTFVWCLFSGVVLRNIITHIFHHDVYDQTIDVLGNVALSFFLAMALMSLQLGDLTSLALPILFIIAVQTIVMILFAIFITFKLMGKDYDAVVMSAGHCGFGLGATPTAIANMQVITKAFGPSHKAFLIVPMVGAFFVDLANSTIIKVFIEIAARITGV